MSNPGYCPSCKESGWACRCGREPLPATTVTDGVEALKPCPFCGAPPRAVGTKFVRCTRCAGENVRRLWNARPQPEGVEDMVERLRTPQLSGKMSEEALAHVYAMAAVMEEAADMIEALARLGAQSSPPSGKNQG